MSESVPRNASMARCMCVLLVLCGPVLFAADQNEDTVSKKTSSTSQWLQDTQFPEISYLRARATAENASVRERELARRVIQRWDNGLVDPEPILVDAWLQRGKLDEYTGRMVHGFFNEVALGTADAALNVCVVDEDRDLLGVRIRERYVLPSGVESSYEETYPAFVERPHRGWMLGTTVILVHFRSGNRVKDERQWQVFLDQARRGGDSEKMAQPPIWVATPDPNAVEVYVSVYDRQGHESDALPVRLLPTEAETTSAFLERQALKPYAEHGADFARWPDDPITPPPDNAALLYYRAIACLPEADPCTVRIMDLMWKGREPEDRVRKYLGDCLKAIQLAQFASQIPECDWGLIRDPLWEHVTEAHRSPLRRLSRALVASARTLAADGHCRTAFENCLVVRRLARHIGDDTYLLYCISCDANYAAMRAILDVLGKVPSDLETLTWLRDQLMTAEGTPHRPAVALAKWRDRELLEWRACDGDKPFERAWALEQIEDEAKRSELAGLTDEQLLVHFLSLQRTRLNSQYGLDVPAELLAQARKEYDASANAAIRIMESDAPYGQKQAKLEELTRESYGSMRNYDPAALLPFPREAAEYYHQFMTSDTAYLNCALAAIQIRLIQTETGQLPEALADGLPKDPFTGADFRYERTADGFVLRFDPDRLSGIRVREFEFAVSDP